MGMTAEDYLAQLQALLPQGPAWPRDAGATHTKLLQAMGDELARVDGRAAQLIEEADPRTTAELLADWERVAGLPDSCVTAAQSTAGEAKDGVEHFEPYGFTSHPLSGAEHVTLFFGGNRSHGVTIVVADRRYRLKGLADGEVALHDDLGHQVHLTRAGIVIRGAGHPVVVTDTPKLRVEADIEATGQIKDLCDAAGKTMSGMRDTYNSHTHPGDSGGTTGTPNQGM